MTKHQRRGKFAYLKATNSLSLGLAVSHAQNQVAGAVRSLDARDGSVQRVVELENVTQQEGERDADAALLAEGLVGIRHPCPASNSAQVSARMNTRTTHKSPTNLGNGHASGALARQRPNPSNEADVRERVPELVRVVHHNGGVITERAADIPVKRTQLHGVACARGRSAPSTVHGAVALRQFTCTAPTQTDE